MNFVYIAVGTFCEESDNLGVFLDLEAADKFNENYKGAYRYLHVEKWDLATNTCEVLCERC